MAVALALAAAPCASAAAPPVGASSLAGARELPVHRLLANLGASGPVRETPQGFAVDVDGWFGLFLPLKGVGVLELDYRATGIILLTWFGAEGTTVPPLHRPPWHHERLAVGAGRITLDFRTTPDWRPDLVPLLYLEGSGTVEITAVRTLPAAAAPEEAIRERDAALRLAPLRIGHSTINWMETPFWSESAGIPLLALAGGAFLAAALAGAAVLAARRRRWAPAGAVALAAVAVALALDAAFALRAAPSVALRPRTSGAERLREGFHLAPELGALTALAAGTLGAGARVGVQTEALDPFAWETICFHLAPRPCVRVLPGRAEHDGLPGGPRLTSGQLDAVVYLHADAPLLPGFTPVASLGRGAYVARRR